MTRYYAERERDGTYSIRAGRNGIIVQVGVRGCNADRVVCKLISDEFWKELHDKHARGLKSVR